MQFASRPTVVLLHSSANSPRQWLALVETLRRDFRVLAVELHGHGLRPDWPQHQVLTLADDAALALPLLEAARGAFVVGHAYGACLALKLASMHPRLVQGVVAYEPLLLSWLTADTVQPRHGQELLRHVSAMRERVAARQHLQAARNFVEFWAGAEGWRATPARMQQGLAHRMEMVVRHFDAVLAEAMPRELLARLGMPMLFLHGSRGPGASRRLAYLLRISLPLAEHDELPGIGHFGPLTHPAIVSERIDRFLRTQIRFATTSVFPRSRA